MDLFGGCWDLAGGAGHCFPAVLSERQSLRSTSSSESESSSSENRKGEKKKTEIQSGRRASFFTGIVSRAPKDATREPIVPTDALGTSPKKTHADHSPERPPLSPVHRSAYSIGAENELHDKWNRPVVW